MALNRAWYNALVDDDGSNTVGTVWGKDDIKNLLDSVDVELARLDAKEASNVWSPTLASAGGGTPTYSYRNGIYAKNGRLVWFGGRIILTSKGSLAAGQLSITGLPYAVANEQISPSFTVGYFSGLTVQACSLSAYMDPVTTAAKLTWIGTPGATAISILDGAHIAATFSITFGGTYMT